MVVTERSGSTGPTGHRSSATVTWLGCIRPIIADWSFEGGAP